MLGIEIASASFAGLSLIYNIGSRVCKKIKRIQSFAKNLTKNRSNLRSELRFLVRLRNDIKRKVGICEKYTTVFKASKLRMEWKKWEEQVINIYEEATKLLEKAEFSKSLFSWKQGNLSYKMSKLRDECLKLEKIGKILNGELRRMLIKKFLNGALGCLVVIASVYFTLTSIWFII